MTCIPLPREIIESPADNACLVRKLFALHVILVDLGPIGWETLISPSYQNGGGNFYPISNPHGNKLYSIITTDIEGHWIYWINFRDMFLPFDAGSLKLLILSNLVLD